MHLAWTWMANIYPSSSQSARTAFPLYLSGVHKAERGDFSTTSVCVYSKARKIASRTSSRHERLRRIQVVMSPAALCYAWTVLLGACMRGIKWDLGVAGINKYISICTLAYTYTRSAEAPGASSKAPSFIPAPPLFMLCAYTTCKR